MSSLADYQRCVATYLLDEQEAPASLAAWCAGHAEVAAARLATYRSTCTATLVNALRLSYPAVRHVLGARYFDAVAAEFARRLPPESAYLNDYGAAFAPFVAELPATAALSYLRDLARLEWAVNRALHAPDSPGLDPARLQSLAPEDLAAVGFRAHPAVQVFVVHFPVERLWQAVLERDDAAMQSLSLAGGRGHLLVERDALHTVQIRRLTEPFGQLTAGLLAGEPLHAVVEQISGISLQPGWLPAMLAEHLACGRFVDFFLNETLQEESVP